MVVVIHADHDPIEHADRRHSGGVNSTIWAGLLRLAGLLPINRLRSLIRRTDTLTRGLHGRILSTLENSTSLAEIAT